MQVKHQRVMLERGAGSATRPHTKRSRDKKLKVMATPSTAPRLVMGLAGMVNFDPVAEKVVEPVASIAAHVAAGIVDLDMADMYPGVEEVAGAFLRGHFASKAGAAASDVRILTKFVPDKKLLGALDAPYVRRIVQRSCNRLGVDAVDRVQLHWWDYDAAGYELVGAALASLATGAAPLLREVGLTNTDTPNAMKLAAALAAADGGGVPLSSVQVQFSLIDRRPSATLAPYCASAGAELLAYGALGGGLLADKWLGKADPTAEGSATKEDVPRSAGKYLALVLAGGGWAPFQATLAACRAVATELGGADVTVAQVALAWVLAQPGVGGAIVGGAHPRHLPSTLAGKTLSLSLSPEQLARLSGAAEAAGGAVPAGDCYTIERDVSTPSGAALAPWTDVGTLGKPPHFEELKRRTAELEKTPPPPADGAIAGVPSRVVLWRRTLEELQQNFGGSADGAGAGYAAHIEVSRAALSAQQRDAELPALESKLRGLAGL